MSYIYNLLHPNACEDRFDVCPRSNENKVENEDIVVSLDEEEMKTVNSQDEKIIKIYKAFESICVIQ